MVTGGVIFLFTKTSFFSKNNNYYSSFTKISGLQESGPVLMHGVKIGKVSDIFLDKNRNLHVTYEISKKIQITEGTTAKIISGDVSGTKAVNLRPADSKKILAPGSYIATIPDTPFIEMINSKITPMIKGGKFLVRTADSSLNDINYLITYGGLGKKAQTQVHIFNKDLSGFAHTSQEVAQQLNSLNNLLIKTERMSNNPGQINNDLNKTLSSGTEMMNGLSQNDYDSLLREMTSSITCISSKVNDIATNNKFFTTNTTYKKAIRQLDSANTAMKNLKEDPPGIQLIGSSKKK